MLRGGRRELRRLHLLRFGAAPQAVEGFRGRLLYEGWGDVGVAKAEKTWAGSGSTDLVELTRTVVKQAAGTKEAVETQLRAGGGDSGGTIDRTVRIGGSYRYSAERVRTVEVSGQKLEVQSVASGSVTVEMLDVFPPNAPGGLVASPGFVAGGQRPAIDLSWEPGLEARSAGYRVYRREGDGVWARVSAALVAVPAYQDGTVEAGRRYGYRVTAVDKTGNESGPSGEVVETAPAR